jgi:ribonuclease R
VATSAEKILEYIKAPRYQPIKRRQLAKKLEVRDSDYPEFRQTIRGLLEQGSIVKLKGGRLGIPKETIQIIGKMFATRAGFGFVTPEEGGEEIFISQRGMGSAVHGDKVQVRILSHRQGKSPEGIVTKIIERGVNKIVGTFREERFSNFVEPDDPKMPEKIYVAENNRAGVKSGQKVVLEITSWKNREENPEGKVIEVLGYPGDKGVDVLSVIRQFELPLEFPEEVEKEAAQIPAVIPITELSRRLDLRDRFCFTIDPIDAKDHDDAVSLEISPEGTYLLGVHIADVSHYVRENSPIDKEALTRGTSVYLPDRVIPMLPERLSNQICSLRPQEERLTYSCLLELDSAGKVLNYDIKETVIKSKAKLNYEEVQAFFDTGKPSESVKGLEDYLTRMLALSKILLKNREKEGSLDFDLPEAKVVYDQQGRILDIFEVARLESHRLIEEFMLLANRSVALHVSRMALPFVYRVHDRPDEEKIREFSELVERLGYQASLGHPVTPKRLQNFLKRIKGMPEEELIDELLLRSLKKAIYQTENIGHFGLAFTHYTHFTSPIRRYPDLMVHRLLKELEKGKYPLQRHRELTGRLPKVCQIASDREKLANEAERETMKAKQVEFMKDKLGEVFPGIVSGVMNFGFFVRLEKTLADGLVRYSNMNDDYYHFDEKNYQAVGRKSKKKFRLGDKVMVRVIRVDTTANQIDFGLVEEGVKQEKKRKSKRR